MAGFPEWYVDKNGEGSHQVLRGYTGDGKELVFVVFFPCQKEGVSGKWSRPAASAKVFSLRVIGYPKDWELASQFSHREAIRKAQEVTSWELASQISHREAIRKAKEVASQYGVEIDE